ncbi:MAG: hypothetical protein N3A65_05845 [candidate division WOR-3 bacterium]|nr:hypothetical protein [candidate division WOR-3 bacterium]
MGKNKKNFIGFVISHTHWDRAWYLPFEKFRIKLLKLTEKLFSILKNNPEFKFIFDGQTVLLEDILQIHPEWETKLKKFISKGNIMVGPWYCLPDEFLVSGESLIRNLLIGNRIARKFGRVMKVGYSPDSFGHIAQLPQILNGFEIDNFIFTRGMGDAGEKLGNEFLWIAPYLESKIIAHHQITGYCNAANLGYLYENGTLKLNYDKAAEQIKKMLTRLKKYITTPAFYISNGCDHLEPQPELNKIIKYLNQNFDDINFIQATPEEFFKYVKGFSKKFKIYKNELRASRYAPLLPGVLSSRIYLKQENFKCQILLEKWVEPFCALTHFLTGQDYPEAEIDYAWRTLLKNHPHDDICGCSVDEVHREDLTRYMLVQQIAETLLADALTKIASYIDAQISGETNICESFVLFNPLLWDRNDPIEIILSKNWIKEKFVIKDSENNILPYQIVKEGDDCVVVLVKPFLVPAFGYNTIHIIPNEKQASGFKTDIVVNNNTIENKFLKVTAEKNGTLTIVDKSTGKIYKNFNILEDTEDAGDEYDFSPAENSLTITSEKIVASIKITESGPVKATMLINYKLFLPESLTPDRKNRKSKKISNPVEVKVSLLSGTPRVDFELKFFNNVKDHRLRVLFPTDIQTDEVKAEEHFHIITRKITLPEGKGWSQMPQPTNHMENFICIDDKKIGVALISEGLPEYEIKKEKAGAVICLTLLRSVGWLSRDDLKTRIGHAGPKIAVPEAQCSGAHSFRYAIMLYKNDLIPECVIKQAYEHNIPMKYIPKDRINTRNFKKINLPAKKSFMRIKPVDFLVTAIKKCEDRDTLIIRLYSIPSQKRKNRLKGEINLWTNPEKVYFTNLNEKRIKRVDSVKRNRISFEAKEWQIITLETKL